MGRRYKPVPASVEGGSQLTPSQRRVVKYLAQGMNCREAATAAKVGYRTIYGWRQSCQAFQDAVEAELRAFEVEADELIRNGLPAAIINAKRLQNCGNEPVELGASKFFLEGFSSLIKQRDQQKELDALKEIVLSLQARLDGAEVE